MFRSVILQAEKKSVKTSIKAITNKPSVFRSGDVTASVISDKAHLAKRIAQVGKAETHWKAAPWTDEDAKRISILVDEEQNKMEELSPCGWRDVRGRHRGKKYGEKNGPSIDF